MNKVGFFKRLCAYVIDVMIVSLLFSLLTMFMKESSNVTVLNNELNSLADNYIKQSINLSEFYNQYGSLQHLLDKELFLSNLLNFVLLIGYFVILPYYYHGQTLGKKLLKIKIISNKGELSCNQLILRNIIVNGFLYNLIVFGLIFLVNDSMYFNIVSILGFVQFLLVIISIFMVLYRHDKKALQDVVSNTTVVLETKEV